MNLRKTTRVQAHLMHVGDLIDAQNEAFVHAYKKSLASGADDETSHASGVAAWKANLPLLTTRSAIQMHIAAVANGMARGYLNSEQAKTLLYSSQMALAAIGKAKL